MRNASIFIALGFTIVSLLAVCCGAAQKCREPANRNSPSCAIVNSVIDCTTDNAKTLVKEFGPAIVELIRTKTSTDGAIDWSSLEDATKSLGIADGMCVLASLTAKPPAPLKPQVVVGGGSSPPIRELNVSELRLGFDRVRSQLAPGVKFHTADGDL